MKRMFAGTIVALGVCAAALYGNAAGPGKSSANKSAMIAHGEYLVKRKPSASAPTATRQ